MSSFDESSFRELGLIAEGAPGVGDNPELAIRIFLSLDLNLSELGLVDAKSSIVAGLREVRSVKW